MVRAYYSGGTAPATPRAPGTVTWANSPGVIGSLEEQRWYSQAQMTPPGHRGRRAQMESVLRGRIRGIRIHRRGTAEDGSPAMRDDFVSLLQVWCAISLLPPEMAEHREVFEHIYQRGLTWEQTADAMRISLSTVARRLREAFPLVEAAIWDYPTLDE